MTDLSVLIASYGTRDLLRECLRSVLAATDTLVAEIIVVDNASGDGSAAMVAAEFPQVRLIANDTNRGFAAANNQAYDVCAGRFVLLLNPDTVVPPEAIRTVLRALTEQPPAGVAGCRTLNADGSLQRSVWRFPSVPSVLLTGLGLDRLCYRERRARFYRGPGVATVDWVQGSFLMLRREAIPSGLLFDEQFFVYGEDKDLCLRIAKTGWRVIYVPEAQIVHHGGQSAALDPVGAWCQHQKSQVLFFRKHHSARTARALQVALLLVSAGRCAGYRVGALVAPRLRCRAEMFAQATRRLWRSLRHAPESSEQPEIGGS